MEHWNAFAGFNRDLNTLRTYRSFRNQVKNMTTVYGSGERLWKKFNDVCQMAAGTYRPPRAKLDEAAVNSGFIFCVRVKPRRHKHLRRFEPLYIRVFNPGKILQSFSICLFSVECQNKSG
ncbi:MAG: hypothetical protein SPK03_05285 [Alloprevotella sp.]|nr:hypothetical protein [Alloprevotella sp.]